MLQSGVENECETNLQHCILHLLLFIFMLFLCSVALGGTVFQAYLSQASLRIRKLKLKCHQVMEVLVYLL